MCSIILLGMLVMLNKAVKIKLDQAVNILIRHQRV